MLVSYKQVDSNDISPVNIFAIIDDFKLALFLMNLILTIVILSLFESKPEQYPTLSQQYHRSKMYEPYLDVKYLLQYKEFKAYAIACSLLLAAINVSQEVPGLFMFVEA